MEQPNPHDEAAPVYFRVLNVLKRALDSLREVDLNIGEAGLREQGLAQAREDFQRETHAARDVGEL